MNYYQFHIGDYITHTVHLSELEDLAYRRLLDLYYQTERPIPTDIPPVSRRLRLGYEPVETVLSEFFELREDGWHNARCDSEIMAYRAYLARQSANGKKGGRPPKQPQKKPTVNPPLTHSKPTQNPLKTQKKPNHLPIPSNQEIKKKEQKEKRVKRVYSEQFDAIWKIYGLKGSKKQAAAQWEKLSETDRDDAARAIPDYIREQPERRFRRDFERYLRDRVFEAVLERKEAGCLNIPTNNRTTYGQPAQKITQMPSEREYQASENVKRDPETGEVIF